MVKKVQFMSMIYVNKVVANTDMSLQQTPHTFTNFHFNEII